MRKMTWLPPLAATFLMGGCMSVPTGPTVMVLPGQQKSLEQFRSDDIACQQYALTLVTPAGDAAVNRAAGTTAASTAIGRGGRCGHRLRFRTGRTRGCHRCRYRPAVRQRRRWQHGLSVLVRPAAALRRRLCAMHVHPRQSGAETVRLSPGTGALPVVATRLAAGLSAAEHAATGGGVSGTDVGSEARSPGPAGPPARLVAACFCSRMACFATIDRALYLRAAARSGFGELIH
jgi:hypothetical protein